MARLGREEDARQLWEAALQHDPGLGPVRGNLEDLARQRNK